MRREKKVAFPVHFSLQINLHCVVIKYPLKIMLSYTSRWISHYSTMISLCKEENVFKVNQVMLGVHKQHKRCGFCFAFEGNINSFCFGLGAIINIVFVGELQVAAVLLPPPPLTELHCYVVAVSGFVIYKYWQSCKWRCIPEVFWSRFLTSV